MDAISFVLGIKSKDLRSAHLSELIYRGRKLLGDADESTQRDDPTTAWVMAVYTDDDGVEHRWKRTITASGSSEYRINEKPVTAAAYNKALEHQNILIKARNFLVFQGDVEAIASQSPLDLTRLIEQISGSLEYKAEYERLQIEQEKAADTSTFNLNRRRGINAEIKQYQEQKKEAEMYQQKMQQRDEAIVTHILWKLFHFQQTIERNKEEIERHQHELLEFRRAHEKYAQKLEDARTEQAKATKSVSKHERKIKEKVKELQEKETGLVPVDEKINIAASHLKKYSARVREIKRDQDNQTATVQSLEKDLASVRKAQTKFEAEQKKALEETGIALSEADLAEYNKLKEQVSTRVAGEQINIDNYARDIKTDSEVVTSLSSKVENARWILQKLESEVADLNSRREEMKATIHQIAQEIDAKKKEYNTLTSERVRNAQKHEELNGKLRDCLIKLSEADDGRRQSEREIRVKEITVSLKRIFPGVKGRVSELCKPKMKKYSEAVSTVLGRHFDAVVVDSEKTATDCIGYLKEQKLGIVTFLPLENIQVKALNSNLKGMHRGMRMAIDTIEFDNSVEGAMLYACGNAVVCDDLQVAKYICFEKGLQVKAVTLDGTVIHKSGLMTGGRVGDSRGRRWEDQEVEQVKRLRDSLLAQIAALPKNRRGPQEEALQGELTGLEQRLSYHRDELGHLERTLTGKQREVVHNQKALSELEPKLREATTSLDALKTKLASLEAVVSSAEDNIFSSFCSRLGFDNIRTYEKQQGSLQQEAQQKRLEFTTQISKLNSQLSFEKGRLKDTKERITKLEQLTERDRMMVEELEQQKAGISEEMDNIQSELEMMREALEGKRTELERRAQRVAELKIDVSKRFGSLEETNKTIAALVSPFLLRFFGVALTEQQESEIERNAAGRYAVLRRCKLEEIKLPLTIDSEPIDRLPIEDQLTRDPDAMDVDDDEDDDALANDVALQDYGIEVDFSELPEDLQETDDDKVEEELLEKMKTLSGELERMAPNMKAIERLEGVESRLHETEREFEDSRKAAKNAKEAFAAIREKRFELFNKAFAHISEEISVVYKDLTKSEAFPLGGTAYLDLEDPNEPVNGGIKYHAMPPLKRFRDMEHLSGGEKTMAALALLFAVHSYQPSPFFVLDEVDAALDNTNVKKISNYIRSHSGPGFQFIVISLKAKLFQQSDALVGIYRDQVECSSKSLT